MRDNAKENEAAEGEPTARVPLRIVFLDFDGVLNSWRFFKDGHTTGILLDEPRKQIDRKAVRHLNTLIGKAGAKVVISSTWRVLHTMEELVAWLREAGFQGDVIGRTPEIRRGMERVQRGEEIDAWLKEHQEVAAFLIFDDGDDMAPHMERLVLVDARKGLKPRHVEAALALFGNAP